MTVKQIQAKLFQWVHFSKETARYRTIDLCLEYLKIVISNVEIELPMKCFCKIEFSLEAF